MIDMAETKKKTKTDDITGEDLVFNSETNEYVPRTMSAELYKQQKKEQNRQALIAGTAGLAAEGIQFGIGASIFGDPAIKAAGQEKARLASELRKDPDYLTEAEKQATREAALSPVQRKAEAVQKRAEKVAASTGDVSVRSLLASGEAGIAQIRQQSLDTEAAISKEDLTRQQLKEQQDEKTREGIEETDAMMLELRNKYIREPLHKFIADAGKLAGTLMAYAPAKTIDSQIERLTALGVPPDKIAEYAELAGRDKRAARKMHRDLMKRGDSEDIVGEVSDAVAPAEPVPAMSWKDDATSGKYAGVEYRLGEDEKIQFTSPKTGKVITVEPGTPAYKSIMDIRPEPQIPEQALTAEQIREQAVELQEGAVREQYADEKAAQVMESQIPDEEGEDLVGGPAERARLAEEKSQKGRKDELEKSRKSNSASEFLYGKDPLDDDTVEKNQAKVKDMYTKVKPLTVGIPGTEGEPSFYQKGPYFYDFNRESNVWTVYGSKLNYAFQRPFEKNGKPVEFSMEEANQSKNPNVRELYDLAVVEGLTV